MKFEYDADLSEFVSDYYSTIEGGSRDSSKAIASLYIESCCTSPRSPSVPELRAEIERLVPQIDYYRF